MQIYEVGGCVRDRFMGYDTKDVDFVAVAPSFDAMRDYMVKEGFKIYIEKPEHLTIRARVPEGHPLYKRTKDADFVMARKEGPYSDGRRPDWVMPGTLLDDLSRRDFTINAIALMNGRYVDPHNGISDCHNRILRFVGNPADRIREDGLRILRAIRFIVTKNLTPTHSTMEALVDCPGDKMGGVSADRIRVELNKMFRFDTFKSMDWLLKMDVLSGKTFLPALLKGGLRLEATLKE